jgi:hypothetical protein
MFGAKSVEINAPSSPSTTAAAKPDHGETINRATEGRQLDLTLAGSVSFYG